MLAGVGETAAQFIGQLADRVLALAEEIQEHQPLGIC